MKLCFDSRWETISGGSDSEEKELEATRLRMIERRKIVSDNIESVKIVMREYYELLCDGFEFYSTWDDVCEEAKRKGEEREERHKRREKRKRKREKIEAERREQVRLKLEQKKTKLANAKEWMNSALQKEQEGIQLRIAEKFYHLRTVQKQSIEEIFVAFDDDGGGTIDPEELRDGFEALEGRC